MKRQARSAGAVAVDRPSLPAGTPDAMVKGALAVERQRAKVGVSAQTVTEATAAKGTAYDHQGRALLFALLQGLDRTDPDLQAQAKALAQVLGVDPQVIATDLQRQQALWDAFGDAWSVHTSVRLGQRVVDGTRQLGRSMVEADVEDAKVGMAPAQAQALEDDLRDYREIAAQDVADRVAAGKVTRGIVAAGQEQIGDFQDRQQLTATLDQLGSDAELPWDVLVKAGATLDRLTATEGQEGPEGPAGADADDAPAGGRRATARG